MDNTPDIPWLYVAMVAIIFVRWLLGQFKAAAEKRRAYQRRLRRGWDEHSQESHNPSYEQPQPPPVQQPAPPSQPQTLQELFEQKRQEIAERQRQMTPPPIPERHLEPEPVQPAPEPVVSSVPAVVQRSHPPRKKTSDSLVSLLANPEQIRNAVVLKEILDKPKGLKM